MRKGRPRVGKSWSVFTCPSSLLDVRRARVARGVNARTDTVFSRASGAEEFMTIIKRRVIRLASHGIVLKSEFHGPAFIVTVAQSS